MSGQANVVKTTYLKSLILSFGRRSQKHRKPVLFTFRPSEDEKTVKIKTLIGHKREYLKIRIRQYLSVEPTSPGCSIGIALLEAPETRKPINCVLEYFETEECVFNHGLNE